MAAVEEETPVKSLNSSNDCSSDDSSNSGSLSDTDSSNDTVQTDDQAYPAKAFALSLDLKKVRATCPVAQLDSQRQLYTPRVITESPASLEDRIHHFFPITSKIIESNKHCEWTWEFNTVLSRKEFHVDAMWKRAWSVDGNQEICRVLDMGQIIQTEDIEKVDRQTDTVTFESSVFAPSLSFIEGFQNIWTFANLNRGDYHMHVHVIKSSEVSKTLMFQVVPQSPTIKEKFFYCRGRAQYLQHEEDPVNFFVHQTIITVAMRVGLFWNTITANKIYWRLHHFFMVDLANPRVGLLF